MDNKIEISNEMIAEALRWWEIRESGIWRIYNTKFRVSKLPDFKNDNNVSWKYLWPEIKDEIIKNNTNPNLSKTVFSDIALAVLESPNPALYLVTEFWKLKKGE